MNRNEEGQGRAKRKVSKPGQGKARNTFVEVPCIIGIDQSYMRTGISICVNGEIKKLYSLDFRTTKYKTVKRNKLRQVLGKAIEACLKKFEPQEINVICERVRTFTASTDMRPEVIKAQSALVATIVDAAFAYGVKVFSVDTRHWKTRILGTSRPIFEPIEGVKNPQKFGSVRKMIDLGFYDNLYSSSGRGFTLNDDVADAGCISLYGFSGRPYQLLLET